MSGFPQPSYVGPPVIPGTYYPNYVITNAAGGAALVLGQLHFYPVMVWQGHTYISESIWVTTGATAALGHFAIYADNGAGAPGNLVLDAGTASMTGSAANAPV